MINKKYLAIGSVIMIATVAALFAAGVIKFPGGGVSPPAANESAQHEVNFVLDRSTYGAALARAQTWHKDAKLARTNFVSEYADGAQSWEFVFVSISAKGKGFRVLVSGATATSAGEIGFTALGGDLPQNIISAVEAVARARSIKGYENVQILGVEMIYGPDGKQWYWGVKTAKGTVTVRAAR